MRIPHQYRLLGLQSDVVKLGCIVAANAGTPSSAVPIVCKAFAVELKALRLAAIAGLVAL